MPQSLDIIRRSAGMCSQRRANPRRDLGPLDLQGVVVDDADRDFLPVMTWPMASDRCRRTPTTEGDHVGIDGVVGPSAGL
jgi:hypothetical protein